MIVTSYNHQKVLRTMVQVDFDLDWCPLQLRGEAHQGAVANAVPPRLSALVGLSRLGWPLVAGWLNQVKIDLNQCPGDFLMLI